MGGGCGGGGGVGVGVGILCCQLFTLKHWESTTNLHSASIFVGYIGIRRFVPHNED